MTDQAQFGVMHDSIVVVFGCVTRVKCFVNLIQVLRRGHPTSTGTNPEGISTATWLQSSVFSLPPLRVSSCHLRALRRYSSRRSPDRSLIKPFHPPQPQQSSSLFLLQLCKSGGLDLFAFISSSFRCLHISQGSCFVTTCRDERIALRVPCREFLAFGLRHLPEFLPLRPGFLYFVCLRRLMLEFCGDVR